MRRFLAGLPRDLLRCVALIPLSLAAITVTLAGRTSTATRWWRHLDVRRPATGVAGAPTSPTATTATGGAAPGAATVLGHALASLVLGLVALVPLGMVALSVLRGLFYGLVDRGPYDNAWGGPSLAGAWLAHLVISVPLVIAGLLVLAGLAAVHRRLGRPLYGERVPAWVIAVTVLATALAVLFFTGWIRQI